MDDAALARLWHSDAAREGKITFDEFVSYFVMEVLRPEAHEAATGTSSTNAVTCLPFGFFFF